MISLLIWILPLWSGVWGVLRQLWPTTVMEKGGSLKQGYSQLVAPACDSTKEMDTSPNINKPNTLRFRGKL